MSMSKSTKVSVFEIRGEIHYAEDASDELIKYFCVLKENTLYFFTKPRKLSEHELKVELMGAQVQAAVSSAAKHKHGIDIKLKSGEVHSIYLESASMQENWLSSFYRCARSDRWPSKVMFSNKDPELVELFQPMKSWDDEPNLTSKRLLVKMMQQASVRFSWGTRNHLQQKETKKRTLRDLRDLCQKPGVYDSYRTFCDLLKMIGTNLFRALPMQPTEHTEEEEMFMDPEWDHLHLVYEILLRIYSSPNIEDAIKKKATSEKFLAKLIAQFKSEDSRERECLKTTTHRIYGKLTNRRAPIRRIFTSTFAEVLYETHNYNGISEILDILASIVNGFAVPIKKEHKSMLEKFLIPLHKLPEMRLHYAPQLSYCMTLFCGKDHTLTRMIVNGLLKYWPCGNHQKELAFLQELDDLFEFMELEDFAEVQTALFARIKMLLEAPHFQVCERTLWFWNNTCFFNLTVHETKPREALLPSIFGTLFSHQKKHWNESVKSLSDSVLGHYQLEDRDLYQKCLCNCSTKME